AFIDNGSAKTKANVKLGVAAPMYLRLARQGDVWTYRYSFDGVAWQTATTVTQAMTLTGVGTHSGNNGNPVPMHTAVVDYFVNLAPIGPSYMLTTAVVGSGSVAKNPDREAYAAGSVVELTAQSALGW